MSAIEKLIADPLTFGKKFPLHPRSPPVNPGSWSKEKESDGETFYQVKGENRIVWLKLVDSYYGSGGYSLDLSAQPKEGYVPIYWLPWGENRVYRTVLRPSKKFIDPLKSAEYGASLVIGSAFSGEKRNLERLERELERFFVLGETDPILFFTAAVNGCSVFIEGAKTEPVVYHANAVDHLLGFDQIDSGRAFLCLQREKIRHMVSQYRKFSSGVPKLPRSASAVTRPSTGVTPHEYLSAVQDENYLDVFKEEVREIAEKYVTDGKRFRFGMSSFKEIKLEEGIGTVYGVRTDGDWSFFYQMLVFVTCLRNEGVIRADWQKTSHWHVAKCESFWPVGDGRYEFRI